MQLQLCGDLLMQHQALNPKQGGGGTDLDQMMPDYGYIGMLLPQRQVLGGFH